MVAVRMRIGIHIRKIPILLPIPDEEVTAQKIYPSYYQRVLGLPATKDQFLCP